MKTLSELSSCLVSDMAANKVEVPGRSRFGKIKALVYLLWFYPNFACVFWLRVNQYLGKKSGRFWRFISRTLNARRIYRFGNDLSYLSEIGPGFRIVHASDIVIGRRARIGKNFTIMNGVTVGQSSIFDQRAPQIGDNVYLGTGSKILGNLTIGDNVTVDALTYCNKSVPVSSVARGNPMKVVSKLLSEDSQKNKI